MISSVDFLYLFSFLVLIFAKDKLNRTFWATVLIICLVGNIVLMIGKNYLDSV